MDPTKDESGRTQVYISREIDIFSNKDAKELIMEVKILTFGQFLLSNGITDGGEP